LSRQKQWEREEEKKGGREGGRGESGERVKLTEKEGERRDGDRRARGKSKRQSEEEGVRQKTREG